MSDRQRFNVRAFLTGAAAATVAAATMVYRRRNARIANHAFLTGGTTDHARSGGSTALVTGASSGIGEAYARYLAALGLDLLLVARRADRLAALAAELHAAADVTVDTVSADLSRDDGVDSVIERMAGLDRLAVLVNNAGFGTAGRFARSDINRQLEMIRVHVLASVRLTRAALPGMLERGRGAVVNVASLGAWIPMLGNVSYVSTKRYLVTFSETLDIELQGTGVYIQALCPGMTHSEFHDRPELSRFSRSLVPGFMWMTVNDVVSASVNALGTGQVVVIPGVQNQALALLAGTGLLNPLMRLAVRRLRR